MNLVEIVDIGWIDHGASKNSYPIYSVHVHPQASKIATAGNDQKIKIWAIDPILNHTINHSQPKLISTLNKHEGAVLIVRWSYFEGSYLASGSDDSKIVIWKRDLSGYHSKGLNDPVSVESWRSLKTLHGHDSDVTDLAWSHDNVYLASTGIDSVVNIWSTKEFDLVRRLEIHTGFVKGVTWDPVGVFLATQSDDKTLKIIRVSDWSVEKEISKPYQTASSSTFFRRLSWSPDGSTIVTSNGENAGYPAAPIVKREGFVQEDFLVGHLTPITVALFNPHMFYAPAVGDEPASKEPSSVCAIGSQDSSISIWWTTTARPPVVFSRLFNGGIMDLAWSPDGLSLFASSWDGKIKVIKFSKCQFGTFVSNTEKEKLLRNYGYKSIDNIPIETIFQMKIEQTKELEARNEKAKQQTDILDDLMSNDRHKPTTNTQHLPLPPLTAMDVDPVVVDAVVSFQAPTSAQVSAKQVETITKSGKKRITPIGGEDLDSKYTQPEAPSLSFPQQGVPISNGATSTSISNGPSSTFILPTIMTSKSNPVVLGLPKAESKIRVQVKTPKFTTTLESGGSKFCNMECTNYLTEKKARIFVSSEKDLLWEDRINHVVLHLSGTEKFFAAACSSGFIFLYSPAGRRLCSPLSLESPVSIITTSGSHLMVITTLATISVWNITTQTNIIHKETISQFLHPSTPSTTITTAILINEKTPKITLSTGRAFLFNLAMRCWTCCNDDGGGRADRAALDLLKRNVSGDDVEQYLSLNEVSDIESRLAGVLAEGNGREYRRVLLIYAQKLAGGGGGGERGVLGKVHEVCDLFLGDDDSGGWDPVVLGMSKRGILKDLLKIFASNRNFQHSIESYHNALLQIERSEQDPSKNKTFNIKNF